MHIVGAGLRQSIASFRGVARRIGQCCGLPGRQSLTGGKIEGKLYFERKKLISAVNKF
jgi:hypothetical protein